MGSTIIEQDFPYDILRRGSRDAARHNKRVDEAARKQLKDIISQQDIITSEGNKRVKVRLKYLDQYRFIQNRDRLDEIGRDNFDELEDGEILSQPQPGSGPPNKAGQGDGEILYEAEYSIDELTEMMFQELELPDLDETKKNLIVSEILEYTDRRKSTGVMNLIDKKKTILANLIRKKKIGIPKDKYAPIINDDLRFRTWDITEEKNSNAVIFLMMDRSGSMWREKIYAVKALYFWIVQFLRRRYDRVEIKFIAHDWSAREMKEKEFFTISDSGGTNVSSAYELCRDMIRHNYNSSVWNIYAFHASDGDTWGDQNRCIELVNEILDLGARMFAYTDINIDAWRPGDSDLLKAFRGAQENREGILVSVIKEMDDILNALTTFLRQSTRRNSEVAK